MSSSDITTRPSRSPLQPGGQMPTEVTTRHEFGALETQRTMEISAQAQAARERAQIDGLYIMAAEHPRDWEKIERNLFTFCQKPLFADAAVWERPVGTALNKATGEWEDVMGEGFSIRFAEEAAREMGNLYIASDITAELEHARILRSVVVDAENRLFWVNPDSVSKYIDRKRLRPGDVVISERTNSRGEKTFTVAAPPDQVRQQMNAALSRTQRNNILRVLPAHIKQGCWEIIKETNNKALEGDERQKTINKMINAFDALRVTTQQLQEFLGHAVKDVTNEEVIMLRGVRNVIFEGQGKWEDVVAAKKAGLDKAKADAEAAKAEAEAAEKSKAAAGTAKPAETGTPAEQKPVETVPIEDEPAGAETKPAGANEATPSTGGFLTGGVPVAAFTADEFRIVTHGLKVLGLAKTRAQVEDWCSRWSTTKEELLQWIEEELRKKEGLK